MVNFLLLKGKYCQFEGFGSMTLPEDDKSDTIKDIY